MFLVQHAPNTSMGWTERSLSNSRRQNAFGCLELMVVRQNLLLKRKEKSMSKFAQVDLNFYTTFWYWDSIFFASHYPVFILIFLNIDSNNSSSASCPTFSCPASCKCKSAQYNVDKAGNCNYWCSKSGYCGNKDAHKKGVDCRDCKGNMQSYVFEYCRREK